MPDVAFPYSDAKLGSLSLDLRTGLLRTPRFGSFCAGKSYYTAGATRVAHNGLEGLRDFIETDGRHPVTAAPYSAEECTADLERVTEGRNDPGLTEVLVNEAAGLR
jgi:hypothetical protein